MDNTNLNPPRLRIWDHMVLRFGIAKIVGLGVGALLLAVSVGVAVIFPSLRGDLRQRASYGDSCGGANQGYCVNDGQPVCNGGYHVSGGDCVRDGATDRADEKKQDAEGAAKVDEAAKPTERYGVTDNLCHLPGANCVTDEDWRKGNAAARGDKKATQELADTGHLKIDEGGNAVAVTQNVNPTSENVAATGGSSNTNNSQVSDAAKNAMDGYLKNNVGGVVVNGCNVNLGLCPMVDPTSGALVGWVPSDKPVFGTFEQAGIARQNLSIGDLFVDDVKLSDGKEIDRVYNYNWQDKKPEELGALITDPGKIAEIKALAEKNKVQTDEKGNVVTNQKGDLVLKDGGTLSKEKFDQAAKQFAIDQENKQKEIIASVQTKEGKYTDSAAKIITECANDPKCSKDELLNKFGGLDLLPKETRDTLMNSVADSYKKTVEEVEKVKKENQAAIKQNTEFYAGATRDQLANQCDKISNAQERLDCGRDPETYVLDLLGITSKADVEAAVAKRKAEAQKIELGNNYANLTDEKLREKYCSGDAARENEDCQDIKKLRENLLSAMTQKEKDVWKESRQINLNADKFANAKSIDELASLACKDAGGSFFGYCFEAEKEKLVKEGIGKSGLIAKISDEKVKEALFVQYNANVKADNAAQAFQGVKPSDFPDLDKQVALRLAENRDRNVNNGCYADSISTPTAKCDELNEQQAIALIVKEKQDSIYKDKCYEVGGTFETCGSPGAAKEYLVKVMNPEMSPDKAKELSSKLDPSFDTAAQLVADKQYQSWKNFDTAKGVVGGLSADVAALIWNPLSAVGNMVTGNWYNSHKDFMTINNPLEVDQNALKIKAQEEVVKKLYADTNSVYGNKEKSAELEMAEKYGLLNNSQILADAKSRVDRGISTWEQEKNNYENVKWSRGDNLAVMTWNELTTGRFKRGNDVLMEGQRTGDLKKIILGSVTQGGDAAALVTAVITAPIGGAIMGVGGGAIVGTGILGAAVSTQMTGQAADVCSQVGGATTQRQCIETSVLAATSWVGMGTSVANQAAALTRTAAQAGTLSKIGGLTQAVGKAAGSTVGQGVVTATQVASQGVGAVNFSSMAQGACNQAKDIHCTALATMALANVVGFGSGFTNAALNTNADKIAELAAGGAALTNVQKAIVNTNNVSTYLHKASAATFVASACGGMFEMGGGHINLDSVSMCGMALHGGIEAARGHPVASKQQENIAKGLEGKIGAEAGKGGGPEVRTAAGVDAEIVKLKADLKAAAEAEGVRVRTTDGKLDGRFNVSDKPALVEMNNRLDALNAERSRLQVAEANAPVQTVAQTPVVAKKSGNPVVDFVSGLFNRGNAIDKVATQTLRDAQTAEKTATEKQKVAVTEANKARAERDRLSALADATTETAVAKIDSLDRELIKLSKTLDSSMPTEVVAAVENLPTDFKTKNSSAVEKVKDLAKQNEALDQQVAAGNISAADAAKNPARSQLKNTVADLNKTISTSKSEVSSEKVKLENLRAEALKTPDLLSKLGEANRVLFEKNSAQLNAENVVAEAKEKTAKAVENSKIPTDTVAIPRLSLWDSIFGKGTGKAAIAEKAPTVETPAEALKRTTAAEKLANDNQTKTAKEAEAARTERNRLKNLSDALDATKINQLDVTAQKLGAKLNAAEPFATEKVLSDLPVDFRTANREEVIKALDQVQRVKEAGTDAARELATKNLSQTLESLGKKMEAKRVETLAEKRTLDNLRDQASKITDLPAQLSKAEANLVDKLGKVMTMEREAIVAKEEVAKAKVSVETQAAATKVTKPSTLITLWETIFGKGTEKSVTANAEIVERANKYGVETKNQTPEQIKAQVDFIEGFISETMKVKTSDLQKMSQKELDATIRRVGRQLDPKAKVTYVETDTGGVVAITYTDRLTGHERSDLLFDGNPQRDFIVKAAKAGIEVNGKSLVEIQAELGKKQSNRFANFVSGLFKGSSKKATTTADKVKVEEIANQAIKDARATEKLISEKQLSAAKEVEVARTERNRLRELADSLDPKINDQLDELSTKLRLKLNVSDISVLEKTLTSLTPDFTRNNRTEISKALAQIEQVRSSKVGEPTAKAMNELSATVDGLNKKIEVTQKEAATKKSRLQGLRDQASKAVDLSGRLEKAEANLVDKLGSVTSLERQLTEAKAETAKVIEVSKIPSDTAAIPKLSFWETIFGKKSTKTPVTAEKTPAVESKVLEKPLTLDEVKQQIEAKKQEILENQKLSDEGGMTGLDRADTLQREIEVLRAQEKELLRLAGVGSSLEKIKNEALALAEKVAEHKKAVETVEGKLEDGGVIDSMKSDLALMEAELVGLQARQKELSDVAGNSGKIDRASKTSQQKIDVLNKERGDLKAIIESKKLETATGELEKVTLEYEVAAKALGDNFQKEYDLVAKDLKLSNAKEIAESQQSIVKSLESQVKNFEKLAELAGKDPNADAVVLRRRAELEMARQELEVKYGEYKNLEGKSVSAAYDKVKQAVGNSDIEVLYTRKLTAEENVRKVAAELNLAKDKLTNTELELVKEQARKTDIDNLKNYLPKNDVIERIKKLFNIGDANKGETTLYEQTAPGKALTLSMTDQAQNSWWNNLWDSIFNRNKVAVPVGSIDHGNITKEAEKIGLAINSESSEDAKAEVSFLGKRETIADMAISTEARVDDTLARVTKQLNKGLESGGGISYYLNESDSPMAGYKKVSRSHLSQDEVYMGYLDLYTFTTKEGDVELSDGVYRRLRIVSDGKAEVSDVTSETCPLCLMVRRGISPQLELVEVVPSSPDLTKEYMDYIDRKSKKTLTDDEFIRGFDFSKNKKYETELSVLEIYLVDKVTGKVFDIKKMMPDDWVFELTPTGKISEYSEDYYDHKIGYGYIRNTYDLAKLFHEIGHGYFSDYENPKLNAEARKVWEESKFGGSTSVPFDRVAGLIMRNERGATTHALQLFRILMREGFGLQGMGKDIVTYLETEGLDSYRKKYGDVKGNEILPSP